MSESFHATRPIPGLVSIVIPVFNGGDYLKLAIDSALRQTYPRCEVIVVNDGSVDGGDTQKAALSYGTDITYIHKANGGVSSALNAGIAAMKGEFFSWLSHDDLYVPEKTEVQMEALERAAGTQILYSDYELIDHAGNHIDYIVSPPVTDMRCALLLSWPINGCTVLLPAHLFDRHDRFDESLRTTQDYDMWFRLARAHRFANVGRVLVKSRVHRDQVSYTAAEHAEKERTDLYIAFLDKLSTEPAYSAVDFIRFTRLLFRNGYRQASRHAARLACRRQRQDSSPTTSRKTIRAILLACALAFEIARSAVRKAYRLVMKRKDRWTPHGSFMPKA